MLSLIAGAVAAYAVYQLFFGDDRDDRPPSRPRLHKPPQPPLHRRDERQHREDIESPQRGPLVPVEASDYASHRRDERQHQENIESRERDRRVLAEASDYASLRARAKQEGDLMSQYYQQSKEAYERRDHAHAKALSEEGKRHAAKMERLNAQASATIFKENNKDKAAGEVDLHGLFVKEAVAYSEKAVTDACRRGDSEIRLIVGQGNHSEGGISRLKPAIQGDMQSRGHRVEVDPRNPGVLLVRLGDRRYM